MLIEARFTQLQAHAENCLAHLQATTKSHKDSPSTSPAWINTGSLDSTTDIKKASILDFLHGDVIIKSPHSRGSKA